MHENSEVNNENSEVNNEYHLSVYIVIHDSDYISKLCRKRILRSQFPSSSVILYKIVSASVFADIPC